MSTLPLSAQRGVIESPTMVATGAASPLMDVLFPRCIPRIEVHVRDALLARERERDKARADALAESNDLLVAQAAALTDANAQLAENVRAGQRLEGYQPCSSRRVRR
ncbi:hypothetical protein [Gemmatimonas sp.]|uniref:hypothetical protein n=1 Tax=Gemmatimonas sp. TaxID=1962908 RepID=UPI00286DDF1C|nr:hypothetical protein [Gemmatimonas sp.]